jgi:general stress protein 26
MPGYGIEPATGGTGLLDFAWAEARLAATRTFWVTSVRPDGRPHTMPVWGLWRDGAFWFSSGKSSRKVRNLTANAACCVTTDDGDEAVIIEGTAAVVTDRTALEAFNVDYIEKYDTDALALGEPILCVAPATVFAFIEKSFVESATRWRFSA